MSVRVSPQEFAWREWVLGEGRFREHGRRNPTVRHLTGAPAKIPDGKPPFSPENNWWQRLEEFLARRRGEVPPQPQPPPVYPRTVNGVVRVSEHFALREFHCRDGTPVPAAAVPGLVILCRDFLQPLRSRFGPVLVTSGYRHRAYNARIGGASQSFHIYDLRPLNPAADVVPREGTVAQWALFLRNRAAQLGRGGVGSYPLAGFVHVDLGPRRNW